MIALRHVEREDGGAARLAWWDEVVIDRFDMFDGDGLEQSPAGSGWSSQAAQGPA